MNLPKALPGRQTSLCFNWDTRPLMTKLNGLGIPREQVVALILAVDFALNHKQWERENGTFMLEQLKAIK